MDKAWVAMGAISEKYKIKLDQINTERYDEIEYILRNIYTKKLSPHCYELLLTSNEREIKQLINKLQIQQWKQTGLDALISKLIKPKQINLNKLFFPALVGDQRDINAVYDMVPRNVKKIIKQLPYQTIHELASSKDHDVNKYIIDVQKKHNQTTNIEYIIRAIRRRLSQLIGIKNKNNNKNNDKNNNESHHQIIDLSEDITQQLNITEKNNKNQHSNSSLMETESKQTDDKQKSVDYEFENDDENEVDWSEDENPEEAYIESLQKSTDITTYQIHGVQINDFEHDTLGPKKFLGGSCIYARCLQFLHQQQMQNKITMRAPLVVLLMIQVDDDENETVKDFIREWSETKFAILIISDCRTANITVGTHWSMCVMAYNPPICYYMDSLGPNTGCYDNINDFLVNRIMPNISDNIKLIYIETPKQQNGYACGMYTIYYVLQCIHYIKNNKNISSIKKDFESNSDIQSLNDKSMEIDRKNLQIQFFKIKSRFISNFNVKKNNNMLNQNQM